MRILIAEDDAISRKLLAAILQKTGYEVIEAIDGNQAWRLMQAEGAPEIALIDWMMPGLDGPTLCRRLKETGKDAPLYLILLTAKNDSQDIASGLLAGADDYIIKPYNRAELQARLKVGIRTVSLQKEIQEYAESMETLARERAVQLAHSDRMATLGVLSAGIAHEINNPASFIAVNVQTLEQVWNGIEKCLDDQADEDDRRRARLIADEAGAIFTDMKDGVNRIQKIVESLKTYSRKGDGHREPCKLADCVHSALRLCHNRLKYHVEVSNQLPDDLPLVLAKPSEIEQIFINLFVNAADAMENMEDDEGRLEIFSQIVADQLAIIVRDNGPGLDPAKAGMIFAPFYTSKGTGKGTGLGLSISRNIAEDHGGSLEAMNHSAGGAEFILSLPLQEPGPDSTP